MNIKINREESEYLFNLELNRYLFGSRLYKTNKEDSDSDILIIYKSFHKESDIYYPNYHQFQYDDIENNIQYIFSSEEVFYKNLLSGDSTINSDIVLFNDNFKNIEDKLNLCRTYKIIKAYLGFSKRDIKMFNKGKNKLFHIQRGLYTAEKLINNEIPIIDDFKNFNINDLEELSNKEKQLREIINDMFDKDLLTLYPKNSLISGKNSLEIKLIESNNIKEFKY